MFPREIHVGIIFHAIVLFFFFLSFFEGGVVLKLVPCDLAIEAYSRCI